MGAEQEPAVSISQSAAVAISRLLWSLGSTDSTSHQHRTDCFHWGAYLDDHRSGLPPWPTEGKPTHEVIAFYEEVRQVLDERIEILRSEPRG
jgi:hypothetical protein